MRSRPASGPAAWPVTGTAAAATGRPWTVDPLPSLVLDVDTPDDLDGHGRGAGRA